MLLACGSLLLNASIYRRNLISGEEAPIFWAKIVRFYGLKPRSSSLIVGNLDGLLAPCCRNPQRWTVTSANSVPFFKLDAEIPSGMRWKNWTRRLQEKNIIRVAIDDRIGSCWAAVLTPEEALTVEGHGVDPRPSRDGIKLTDVAALQCRKAPSRQHDWFEQIIVMEIFVMLHTKLNYEKEPHKYRMVQKQLLPVDIQILKLSFKPVKKKHFFAMKLQALWMKVHWYQMPPFEELCYCQSICI
ncbi:hypothetical protein HUJ04_007795 [Dendroctonus ponderosae]|nr:hypothetical protein HUJ04_007795 [Dendroctonus ponderosae]